MPRTGLGVAVQRHVLPLAEARRHRARSAGRRVHPAPRDERAHAASGADFGQRGAPRGEVAARVRHTTRQQAERRGGRRGQHHVVKDHPLRALDLRSGFALKVAEQPQRAVRAAFDALLSAVHPRTLGFEHDTHAQRPQAPERALTHGLHALTRPARPQRAPELRALRGSKHKHCMQSRSSSSRSAASDSKGGGTRGAHRSSMLCAPSATTSPSTPYLRRPCSACRALSSRACAAPRGSAHSTAHRA